MITIRPWIPVLMILATALTVSASSLAHTVFLPSDKSINAFGDRFIQRIVSMDRKELYAIPQMNDTQFLFELANDADTLGSLLLRSDGDGAYESIFDDKLDDQLSLQDKIDEEWEILMTAGPLAVNYIGNLVVLASKRDFPLARPLFFSFQHIENPNSFRATILQVARSMYSALFGAHIAMDRIQLSVQLVPDHIKTALKLIIAGSPNLIQIMLPRTLEFVGRITTESASHAKSVFNKFSSLQELVAEIIEASINSHSSQAAIVEKIKSQINYAKTEQRQFDSNMKRIQQHYEEARKAVEKARQEYHDAYNAIPAFRGWFGNLFRKVIKAVVNIITAPIRTLGCILGLCYTDQSALNAATAAAETAKQNAQAKAKHLLGVLTEADDRHVSFAQQQVAEQQKLIAIMNKIAALNLTNMSEQEILDILIESILQLNQIKEQWSRLIQFFSKLSVQVDSTQQIIMYEIIAAIKEAQASNLLFEPSDRELFVELLTATSQEIERGAHLLFVMSKTYFDISSEYMIDQIGGTSSLLLLQTDTERLSYIKSLVENTNTTSARVSQLAQERQRAYAIQNQARRGEYERFLRKLETEDLKGIAI